MTRQLIRCLSALLLSVLLLSACAPSTGVPDSSTGSSVLTWNNWTGYQDFLSLAAKTFPDIELELTPYAGGNRTGYSWTQMRGDDIPDIFITSQILDKQLASERLADLSEYSFTNRFSTAVLDQVAIDGGIYLLPVNYAMYGIFYNKTLMEEHGWTLPSNFAELEALCQDIRNEGLIPGVLGTQLTGNAFSTVFNLAKTSWLTTPEGLNWERDFLSGKQTAAGTWESTMDYVQRYIDIGMFTPDPENRNNPEVLLDYLGNRKAVFCTAVLTVNITQLPETGDELGMMPFISEDGSKNTYMYSPTSYIGISRRLTQPGSEEKLEDAVRLLSLLCSPEGQSAFITDQTPCVLSLLSSNVLPEDAMIYDAQQALREGRAFPMTYANWEDVLSDMGQVYTDWFRGENGVDGPECIARMDELQQDRLSNAETLYFCESTADFTLEETGELVGKALGAAVGADAALIPIGPAYQDHIGLRACVTGKLYAGKINLEIVNTLVPSFSGEYAVMTMTGAQAKQLAQTGFDAAGDGSAVFPYVLVTRGGQALEDGTAYQVAFLMEGYTEQTGQTCKVQVHKGSLTGFLRAWLEEQRTVSPGGNPWT